MAGYSVMHLKKRLIRFPDGRKAVAIGVGAGLSKSYT
jgi:uncharacterized protein (DUF2062 family)